MRCRRLFYPPKDAASARHLITTSVSSALMALALCCGVVLAVNLGRHAVVRTGSTMSPAPLKGGVALHSDRAVALPVGSRVQAVDGDGAILHGSVVEERESSPTWILGRVRVRFDGWSARFDEWYPVDSPLLTPLAHNLVERAALRVATVCLGAHDRLALESTRPPRRGTAGLRLTTKPRRATSTRPAPSAEALRDAVKVSVALVGNAMVTRGTHRVVAAHLHVRCVY